jgi:hypothetical protein
MNVIDRKDVNNIIPLYDSGNQSFVFKNHRLACGGFNFLPQFDGLFIDHLQRIAIWSL